MKFATLCALASSFVSEGEAMSLPVFDSSAFDQMYEESQKMLTVN